MSFIKTRSIFIALAICVAAVATLASLPKMALAGELVGECNSQNPIPLGQAKSDETIARAAHDRLNCYAKKMVSIKQDEIDINTLNNEVLRIRGKRIGEYKKYSCKLSYVTVNFPVSGGVCSSYWNEEVKQRSEYLRLTCNVGIPFTDETFVKPAAKAAEKNKREYGSCFDRSISKEIRKFYDIKNAGALKKDLELYMKKWKKEDKKRQYDELTESCKDLAESIASRYVKYAKKNSLYCDQWSN